MKKRMRARGGVRRPGETDVKIGVVGYFALLALSVSAVAMWWKIRKERVIAAFKKITPQRKKTLQTNEAVT